MSMLALIHCALMAQLPSYGGVWEAWYQHRGTTAYEQLGANAASAADLDGDRVPDIGIASHSWPSTSSLAFSIRSSTDGRILAAFHRPPINDGFGAAIAVGADLDGDGVGEFYVGAPYTPSGIGTDAGAVYVLDGAGLRLLGQWSPAAGSRYFGAALVNLGDQDGDGVDDVAVSAPATSIGAFQGRIEIRSGATGAALWSFDTTRFRQLGEALASVPDLDGDLRADLAAGAKNSYGGKGAVILLGSASRSIVYEAAGANTGDYFGDTIATAPDLNFDAAAELLVMTGTNSIRSVSLLDGRTGTRLREIYAQPGFTFHPGALLADADLDADGSEDFLSIVRALPPDDAPRALAMRLDGLGWRMGPAVLAASPAFGSALAPHQTMPTARGVLICDKSAVGASGTPSAGAVHHLQFHPGLLLSDHAVRAYRGGLVEMRVAFPTSEALLPYVVAVSAAPGGSSLFGGITIPLVQDSWFRRTLVSPPAFLSGSHGRLNADGTATARLSLAPGAGWPWIGRTLWLAAITGENGAARSSSVARYVTIIP
jgi:hypothetical protein